MSALIVGLLLFYKEFTSLLLYFHSLFVNDAMLVTTVEFGFRFVFYLN